MLSPDRTMERADAKTDAAAKLSLGKMSPTAHEPESNLYLSKAESSAETENRKGWM